MLRRKTPLKAKSGFKKPTLEQMAESGLLQRGSTFKAKPKRLPVRKKREGPTQMDVFRKIWAEREHVCEVCGRVILLPRVRCFSHLLGKGEYPELKHAKENIELWCCDFDLTESELVHGLRGCHEAWTEKLYDRSHCSWTRVLDKVSLLKKRQIK